jgi:hypothetical protein
MQGLFAAILQVLAPYPGARAAVAQALAGQSPTRRLPGPANEDKNDGNE